MVAFLGFLSFVCLVVCVISSVSVIVNVIKKRSVKKAITILVLSIFLLSSFSFIAVTYFHAPVNKIEVSDNKKTEKESVSEVQSTILRSAEEQTESTQTYIEETTVEQITEPETVYESEKEISSEVEENETTSNGQPEYISVSASDIIDLFRDNQVRCEKLYDKQTLRITGRIDSIGTDVLGKAYVSLGHDKDFTFVGIQCYAKDKDTKEKISELSKGDIITVEGIGNCGSMSFSIKKAEIID